MSDKGNGLRFNKGKLRYDLVQPHALEGMVKILTKGAEKYAERNWEKGMKWSNVISSLKRHLASIEKGEDFDQETGELHVDHLQCNAHFLSAYYRIFPQGDDRVRTYLQHPKIGLDIDEVLADWVGEWSKLHGMDIPKMWHFDKDIGKKFEKMREKGTLEDFYLNLPVKTNPDELGFEPHCYITSRPCKASTTLKWLEINKFPVRPIYSVEVGKTKVDAAKESGAEWVIDDRMDNFVELNNAGVCCFLYDAPHNERYDVGYRRIKDFKDFKQRFL